MKVLFFAPHSAIWVHAFPEALIAESLAQHGHEIVYATCGRQFAELCIPMSAYGLGHGSPAPAKNKICDACEKSADLITRRFGFRRRRIVDCLSADDRAAIASIVANVTPDNFLDIRVHGIEVGRLALYELLLGRKKQNLRLSESEWVEYTVQLKNALSSLFAARTLLDEERPDRVVAYNTLYSVNNVACQLSESRGIPTYFLHAGGNLSRKYETMLIGRRDGVRFYDDLLSFWHRICDQPCGRDLLAPVTDHFLELLLGRSVFVYSAPRSVGEEELRARWRIAPGKRVLVATMSSPDERFAAETIGAMRSSANHIFASQVEWIRHLCAWVGERPDLFLVIRVHPREFPNKRESVTSDHARALSDVLANVPPNVVVNWPSDNVSLYDLSEVADVFLNAWSAAGKEMALLGLPVVVYAPELLAYPPSLNYVGESRDGYFDSIGRALRDGWSIERTRMTYRWCAFEYERAIVDLRESFSNNLSRPPGRIRTRVRRWLDRVDPHLRYAMDCWGRASTLRAAATINEVVETGSQTPLSVVDFQPGATSMNEETQALRIEVRRLLEGLANGPAKSKSGRVYKQLLAFAEG
jgi:hypothetical protein